MGRKIRGYSSFTFTAPNLCAVAVTRPQSLGKHHAENMLDHFIQAHWFMNKTSRKSNTLERETLIAAFICNIRIKTDILPR